MKKHLFFIYALFLIGAYQSIYAQINITVKVKSVSVSTALDCDAGPTDNSDFVFEYKAQDNSPSAFSNNSPVAGSIGMCNYVAIDEQNGSYTLTPTSPGTAVFVPANGVFFNRSYNCKHEVPTSLTVTWTAYENDDISAPSVAPIANGTITPQVVTYNVPVSNGTYTTQFTQTSLDGTCPQTYVIEFEIEKTVGAFSPLAINFLDGSTICTGATNGDLEASFTGGSGSVLVDWSVDGLGDYNDNTNISGISAGSYTIVVKDALNCTDTGVVAINEINPPVNLTAFSVSSSTVCANQAGVTYAVPTQTNVTFFWNYSGGIATINGTGHNVDLDFGNAPLNGTLSVYAQNSCSTTATLSMTVDVLSAPNVVISGNNNMCDNAQEVLTASGATSYTWNTGASSTSITITPTITTIYTVTGTDVVGCIAAKSYTMNVQPSPTVQVSGSTVAVCPGQTVALTATGSGALFIWSDGFIGANHTVQASYANPVYTITNTYTNSCFSQITFTVNVLPGPTLAIVGNTVVCDKALATFTASGASTYAWNSGLTSPVNSFTITTPTTITVVGTTTNGCVDSLSKSIIVAQTPSVSISGNDTICQGATANLIANSTGTVSYSWNSGAITQSISVTPLGTFTYAVIVSNGACNDTAYHEVFVHLLPTVDFVISTSPLCNNGSVFTLTATPSGGVYSGTGVTGNTFDPTVGVGIYPIIYSVNVSNACAAAQTQTIEVMLCSGINEIENNSLLVYPNPVSDFVNIQSDKEIKTILVYDYSGKLVKLIEANTFETSVNISNLAKGFYSFNLTMNDRSQKTIKIVKE